MPYKYGNAPGLLQETISKITYKSEYTTSFTGERVPLQNVRIPAGLKKRTAWDEARKPETSRAIQLPFHHRINYPARINLQGLQPSPTARARSAFQRPSSNASQISRSSGRRPTSSVSAFSKRERPSTEDLLRRPQSLVARRPQSELSRFPKEFRYIDKQCFFHPATEPRYKAYFDRFDTKSFQTEYTTRYCNSEEHLLYSQIPKHPWSEPRRPAAASRYISYGAAARPTHLRPPFAARMLSYVPDAEGRYTEQNSSRAQNENSRRLMYSFDKRESFKETYLTDLRPKRSGDLNTVPTTQSSKNGSPKKNLTDGQVLQKLGVSSPHALCKKVQLKNHSSLSQLKQNQINHMLDLQSPLPASITLSVSNKQPRTFTKRFVRPALARDRETMASHFTTKNREQVLERVAPRPSTLLSKHSKNVRYVRDTCFFHPTEDRKKHYYIVNPNWFSEQRVKIPKNNVFS